MIFINGLKYFKKYAKDFFFPYRRKYQKAILKEWDTYDISRLCNNDESLGYFGGILLEGDHGYKFRPIVTNAPKEWINAKRIERWFIELNGIKLEFRCQIYKGESSYRVHHESWFLFDHTNDESKFINHKSL